MKPGSTWAVLYRPDNYFDILGAVEEVDFTENLDAELDGVHYFVVHRTMLETDLESLAQAIYPNGMLWISWYKKSAGNETDINEYVIRELVLPKGLVDVKVCAVDDQWSGLKIVWRRALRG